MSHACICITCRGFNPRVLAHEKAHLRGCGPSSFCSTGPLCLEKRLLAQGAHPLLLWSEPQGPPPTIQLSFNSHIYAYIRTRPPQCEDSYISTGWGTKTERKRGEDREVRDVEKIKMCSQSVSLLLRQRGGAALHTLPLLWKTNYDKSQKVKGAALCMCAVCLCLFVTLRCRRQCSDCRVCVSVIRGSWCNHDIRTHSEQHTATHKAQVWAGMSHPKNSRRAVYISLSNGSLHWSLLLHNAEHKSARFRL